MKKILLITYFSIAFIFFLGCDDTIQYINDSQIDNGIPPQPKTIHVPGDAKTIQAGIALAGLFDTVLVADGYYSGTGNRDINFLGKSIMLKSVNGPKVTIIDCKGKSNSLHRGFHFTQKETNAALVDGFTVKGGYAGNGGAIYCHTSSPTIINSVFEGNHATASGGAIWCKSSQAKFINCTIVMNSSVAGSGLFVSADATPSFENCIIAFNTFDKAVYIRSSSLPNFKCCNIYGNADGDWSGAFADQATINGNLHSSPMFCDMTSRNFQIQSSSPCAPENNNCTALIGALEIGCQ